MFICFESCEELVLFSPTNWKGGTDYLGLSFSGQQDTGQTNIIQIHHKDTNQRQTDLLKTMVALKDSPSNENYLSYELGKKNNT